mmetsp:Transcript_6400/g.25870  ORF Transcript_6400/g.25870 Transcript_6400/m.25870 type:complete len:225 (-) Transcript_6400:8310-8984(-)
MASWKLPSYTCVRQLLKTSCARAYMPCCMSASPDAVSLALQRLRQRPAIMSCSPRRRYRSASASKQRVSCGKRLTWLSSIGMATCQVLYVRPMKRISSLGTLGWGSESEMLSRSACITFGRCCACLRWHSLERSAIIGFTTCTWFCLSSAAQVIGKKMTHSEHDSCASEWAISSRGSIKSSTHSELSDDSHAECCSKSSSRGLAADSAGAPPLWSSPLPSSAPS